MSEKMDFTDPLWSRHYLMIKALATLYVVGLGVSHAQFDPIYVWAIAVFFSVAMNFTYPWAAFKEGHSERLEIQISLFLCALSLAALFTSPLLVIAAIFLHGLWDLAKHKGHGTAFFGWYVSGCFVVDVSYSAALLWYYLQTSGGV